MPPAAPVELGCAVVNVVAQPRGSRYRFIPDIGAAKNWSSMEWHRLTNDVSGGQLRIEGRAQCCDWASRVKPWRDEIAVYYDNTRVWSGAVTQVHWVGDELRIDCKDRMEWMRRRKIHNDHVYGSGVDMTTIFVDAVEDALSVDDSPNINLIASACGTTVGDPEGRKYLGGQNIYANDVINECARTGVSWTVLDHDVYVSGPRTTVGAKLLRPKHFEDDPEALLDGNAYGTRFIVSGAGRGDDVDQIVGSNTPDAAAEALYGVHERLVSEPLIRDNLSAGTNARHLWEQYGRDGIPFYLLGGRLSPNAPVGINDLIPGNIFKIQTEDTCKPVPEFVRLASVTGSVGPEHQWIEIVTEPMGTLDDDN